MNYCAVITIEITMNITINTIKAKRNFREEPGYPSG